VQRVHRRAHWLIWLGLSVLLPALLFASLLARRDGPLETPAVRLAP
jgi:hypothetical protein